MRLTYNGCSFTMFDIPVGIRENVYSTDGVDLLYTKHRYQFLLFAAPTNDGNVGERPAQAGTDLTELLLGPDRDASTSLLKTGGNVAVGGVTSNVSNQGFPHTDAAMRYLMMIPRKRLSVTFVDYKTGLPVPWISAPLMGGPSDVANGPTPISFDVIKPQGEGVSAMFAWTVEFNQCSQPTGEQQLILSHRWQTTHTTDEDSYLTRIIRGEVIAHGELLRAAGHELDWYRNQFFHPIPTGMKRDIPEVTQSSDGLTIRYEIRDRDAEIMFAAEDSGATQIAIHESINRLSPDYVGVIEDAMARQLHGKG